MLEDYLISCESTADIPYDEMAQKGISVLFYRYVIDQTEFEDNMSRSDNSEFYEALNSGKLPSTSQINEYTYYDYFKQLTESGKMILHIAFGSGMTPSVNNAKKAAESLNSQLGGQKVFVIDSICSSSGYGMLVNLAYEYAKNKSVFEVMDYCENIKGKIHHQFFSTDMNYFKRSGRVSGAAATVATILGICPIMRLDARGKIIAYDKVRGKRKAIERTLNEMMSCAENGDKYDGPCYINHSNCLNDAMALKKEVEQKFGSLRGKVKIYDIGNIVASHCGPGTVAIFFVGSNR